MSTELTQAEIIDLDSTVESIKGALSISTGPAQAELVQAALIRTQTLIDISGHSSKAIRLSKYMLHTEAPLLVDKLGYVDKNSDALELMSALDADLNSTVKMLKSIALMVDVLGDDHCCLELKNDENDFRKLFPKHYDPDTKVLTIFGVGVSKRNAISTMDNKELKERLYHRVFGERFERKFLFADYVAHMSLHRAIEKTGVPSKTSPFLESLSYATLVSSLGNWESYYQEVMSIAGHFHELRKVLNDVEREIVDDKIYSGRTMLYGVIKSSTYITKEAGLMQVASNHKKNKEVLDKVVALVGKIDCIRAVEIDQDSDLTKFHDMLVDVGNMKLDIPDSFELKSRKLGNYRMSGVSALKHSDGSYTISDEAGYSSEELRLIAVDLSAPTAIAHEITHFRDRVDDNYRKEIIDHFKAKIDVDALSSMLRGRKVGYYMSDREVLARLGEIGFLLNKHEYQPNESLDAFSKRVSNVSGDADGKLKYDVALSKSCDFYMAEGNVINKEVYFDFANWAPSELAILRDYTHNFFYKDDPRINNRLAERINAGELDFQSMKYDAVKAKNRTGKYRRREVSDDTKLALAFSKLGPDNLCDVYKIGVELELFKDGEFSEELGKYGHRLLTNKKGTGYSIPLDALAKQGEAFSLFAEFVDLKERPGDALVFNDFIRKLSLSSKALTLTSIYQDVLLDMTSNDVLKQSAVRQAEVYWGSETLKYDISERFGKNTWLPQKRASIPYYVGYKEGIAKALTAIDEKIKEAHISPLSMRDCTELAKWNWIVASVNNSFDSNVSAISEPAFDMRYELNAKMSARHAMTCDASIVENSLRQGFSPLLEISDHRSVMAEITGAIDEELALSFIQNKLLSKYNVTSENINNVLVKLGDMTPNEVNRRDEVVWSFPRLDRTLSGTPIENLNAAIVALSQHSSRTSPSATVQSRTLLTDYSLSADQSFSLSPMSAVVAVIHAANKEDWRSVSEALLHDIATTMPTLPMTAISDRIKNESNISTVYDSVSAQLAKSDCATSFIKGAMLEHDDVLMCSKPTKLLHYALSYMIAADWVDKGAEMRPSVVLSNAEYGVNSRVVMYPGERLGEVRLEGAVAFGKLAHSVLSHSELPPIKIEANRFFGDSQDTIAAEKLRFMTWVNEASMVSPLLTAAIVQGIAPLAGNNCRLFSEHKEENNALSKAVSLAANMAFYPMVSNELYGDVRPYLESITDVVVNIDVSVLPEVIMTIENHVDVDVVVDNTEKIAPTNVIPLLDVKDNSATLVDINEDVPSAEGQTLKQINQFKLF
jgi:hypothetical protein